MGWAKLTDQRALNQKLRTAGLAARGLDEAAICQVAADRTDGHIAFETVEMLALAHGERQWKRLVSRLVEVGRWETNGTGWYIHDFLEFNPTRAESEAQLERKRAAGSRGGRAKALATGLAGALAAAEQRLEQPPSTVPSSSVSTVGSCTPSRPDPTRKSSSSARDLTSPRPPNRPDDDDEMSSTGQAAIRVLADRRIAEVTGPIGNPSGYRHAVMASLAIEHSATIASLDLAAFSDPASLADHLEPPNTNGTRPGLADTTQAAQAEHDQRLVDRQTSPCRRCDGDRFVGGDEVSRCPDCDGTGIG